MRHFILLLCLSTVLCSAQTDSLPRIKDAYQKEVDKLGGQRKLQEAFKYIDALEPVTRANLIEITEIPAPPFMEMSRAVRYKELLEAAGADSVWIDTEGNVLALRKGKNGSKTVVLNAHLDTVFPEGTDVSVTVRNDTLFAPGIGDDSRGLAMVLTVLQALDKASVNTKADLLFVATVGEEGLGDLRGVKHLFTENSPKIDSWIAIDGGEIGRITNKALGSYRYRITFNGPGGHSWGAFGLGNPHHAAGKAIDYFVQAAEAYTAEGPKTSYNVGRTGGGTSVNSIPFESWMEIDMRSVSPERLKEIEAILLDQVHRALEDYNKTIRQGEALTVSIEKIGDRPSGELSEDLPLVQRALAVTRFFGSEPSLSRGSTDSNIPISMGIPSVTIGRGGQGGGAHSLDEWWLNDVTGAASIKLALLLLVSEAGLER
jgi:acetylornithine deacetylase/succinyl-diaminopimelate desuccinylase-like protein